MLQVDRRRAFLAMSTVLAVVVGLMTVIPPPAQAAFTGPWSITMVSEREYIGGGTERFFDDANATMSASGDTSVVGVRTEGGVYGEYFTFEFYASDGRPLAPGWYPDAQRYPFQVSGRPGMDISGEHRGCNEISGNFEVRDIAWSPTGALQRLWLIYEQHCEGGIRALFGEIRLGMPSGAADVEPDAVRWPEINAGAQGETVPVRVRATGTSAVAVSAVTLGGAHAQDFSIRSDECTGLTLGEGDTCLVHMRFVPKSPGPRSAVLRIATATATFPVGLDGLAVPGVTDWQMTSDTGDYIGAGKTYLYTSAFDTIGYRATQQYVSGGVNAANGDWWGAEFAPAQGDVLVAGATYSNARRYPFNGSGPGMDVSGNGRGCNTLVGSFTVNQIGFSSTNGALDRLDLNFEQHCEGATPALRGRLRYRARADFTPPAQAAGVTVTRTSDTSARVTWTSPSDSVGTVVRYLPGPRAPGAATVGHLAHTGNGTAVDVSGLKAGRAHAFALFTYDSTGNVSRARVVSIQGSARQTIALSPSTFSYGSSTVVRGVLTDLDGVPIAGHTTRLQSRPAGTTTWTTVSTLTTSSTGTVSTSVKPSSHRDYRLVSDATSAYEAATSSSARATVRQKVTAAVNDSSITLGQTVTVRGSVAPNHAGKSVSLQRYYSGAWQTLTSRTLSSTSTYSFSYKPNSAGTRTIRVYRPADSDHASGTSPTLKMTVNS